MLLKSNLSRYLIVLLLLSSISAWAQNEEVISGELEHYIEDDFDKNISRDVFYIKDEKTQQTHKLEFRKGKIPEELLHAPTGSKVKMRGKKSDDLGDIILADDGEVAFDVVTFPTRALKGVKKVLAVRVNFADRVAVHNDEATVYKVLLDPNHPTSTNNFYKINSQNNLSLIGDVTSVKLNINAATTTTCDTDLNTWTAQANTLLTNAGFVLSNYTNLQYYLPAGIGCPFAGRAGLGGTKSWIAATRIKTIAHELGHNYGLHHANTPTTEYADYSCSMSGGEANYEFNAPHKFQLGWVPNERLVEITANGTYRVSPMNADSGSSAYPQVYRIKREATADHYYISFRDKTDVFDFNLTTTYADRLNIHYYKELTSTQTYFVNALSTGGSYQLTGTNFFVDSVVYTKDYIEFKISGGSTSTVDTTPPTVSLTSPSNGAQFAAGSTVSASASASDNVGVTKVEFYVNNALKCSDTTSPYSCSFLMPTGSSLPVKARAYDAAGNMKDSTIIYISESQVDSTPPSVSLTSPSNGAQFAAGSTVSASASASDNVGVTKVEFYVNNALKCSDTTSPYLCSFLMPTGSSIPVKARAYDAAGNMKDSTIIYISESQVDSTPPSVSLTSPSNGAEFAAGSTVSASASASDNVGVSKVEFYVNNLLKCSDTTAPFSCSFTMPTGTNISVRARAHDAAGNMKDSSISYISNPTSTVDTTPPSVPQGLSLEVKKRSDINLSFSPSTDNVKMSHYEILRNSVVIGQSYSPSFTDPKVPNGSYSYQVRAVDAAGNKSALSAAAPIDISGKGQDKGN